MCIYKKCPILSGISKSKVLKKPAFFQIPAAFQFDRGLKPGSHPLCKPGGLRG